jgi:hypothetical protein
MASHITVSGSNGVSDTLELVFLGMSAGVNTLFNGSIGFMDDQILVFTCFFIS